MSKVDQQKQRQTLSYNNVNVYLQTKYKAEKAEAQANLEIYFTNKVGVAEHPNVVESMDKLMEQYANADEKLRILEEEF